MTRTQVAIIGAGPAGLMLGHLLDRCGIDSVIIEERSREHLTSRVRAGVLEQHVADLMIETGVGERLRREGQCHGGIQITFGGVRHRIDLRELTGKSITVYGQNELVTDLVDARIVTGRPTYFDAKNVRLHGLDSIQPEVRFRSDDTEYIVQCDFIAGCDGFHGVCRASIPPARLTIFEKPCPFAWLGILSESAPALNELVYSLHERGFALFSMRSPKITRLYLQCGSEDHTSAWPDDRVWSELMMRLGTDDGWKPNPGPTLQKRITPMRSFVVEPMQYGRLFLAGDAAHIVPPTGAKGLNLAVADVRVLANALSRFYTCGDQQGLSHYSDACLQRVWKVQRFSLWMTSILHRFGESDGFDYRCQLAELDYITGSRAGMTTLAENYVGLPIDVPLPLKN